jgi:membrane fusion protein (multidrug efflux system)
VRLTLEDGSAYGYAGQVQFSDIAVDESTGTVTVRASFPNPQGLLLPGMFVKAVFDQAVRAARVPRAAARLQRDFDGSAFVYVVRRRQQGAAPQGHRARTSGTNWVVTAGLRPGD